jgi:UPF0755 protein
VVGLIVARSKLLRSGALLIALCVLGAALVAADAVYELHKPLPLQRSTVIEVRQGDALRTTLRRIQAQGVIDSQQRIFLALVGRVMHRATSVRAGEYSVDPGTSALGLLRQLRSGQVLLREARIIEGWTVAQALQTLRSNPYLEHTAATADADALMRALGRPGLPAEGQFFPDTYRFARGTPDLTVLKQAFDAMQRRLAEAWQGRDSSVPYATPEEALTIASLIEKESAVDAERKEISGVFVRRLKLGMRLQTDPAVIYGLGDSYEGRLHTRDLTTDTPYNTYTRSGLPPTPICLPSEGSLQAAMHPAPGDALYFVARGDGTHQFSATLKAHDEAVRRFQLGQGPAQNANRDKRPANDGH